MTKDQSAWEGDGGKRFRQAGGSGERGDEERESNSKLLRHSKNRSTAATARFNQLILNLFYHSF